MRNVSRFTEDMIGLLLFFYAAALAFTFGAALYLLGSFAWHVIRA